MVCKMQYSVVVWFSGKAFGSRKFSMREDYSAVFLSVNEQPGAHNHTKKYHYFSCLDMKSSWKCVFKKLHALEKFSPIHMHPVLSSALLLLMSAIPWKTFQAHFNSVINYHGSNVSIHIMIEKLCYSTLTACIPCQRNSPQNRQCY